MGHSVQVFAFQDISKHKQAELALTVGKEAAEAANAAKSDFLANVSHELRTPLTSILGFAKIIQKRLDERIFPIVPDTSPRITRSIRQVSGNLDIIQAEGQRLTTLINNVLDLEKIESGKMNWQMETLSISDLIAQAVAATDVLFKEKGLNFVQKAPDKLPDIVGDRDKLIQVIINLISNAIKFTNEGTITCQVETNEATLVIHIQDEGVGIEADDLPLVFEKFKQVGDTLTDKPHGTGLGLPICKQIVEYHDGQIWAKSVPGQGSIFSFSLPIMGTTVRSETQAWTKAINIDMLVEQLEAHGVKRPATEAERTQKNGSCY